MEPIPLIVPRAVRPLLAFAERIGAPCALPRRLREGQAPLPLAYAGEVVERLAAATGAESFGLQAGAAAHFEDSPLGNDVRQAPTVGAALRAAARTSGRYAGGQSLSITERGEDVWLRRRFPDALRRGRRQANDFALQMLIDVVRRGAGPQWRPGEIHLEGAPPAHAGELAALAEGPVRFGAGADCLVFPRRLLALPLSPSAGPAPLPSAPLPDLDFAGSVRETIRSLLELGELSLPGVAEASGTSVHSLQRRLAASGLSFGQLADEARFRVASGLLRDPAVRIVDISAELGYSDAANFTRAFRRWAGVSPLAFRRAAY